LPRFFLYRIQSIIDKIGGGASDGLTGASPEAVIAKGGGETGIADGRELIPRIPRIGRRDARFRHRGQITVPIIRSGVGSEQD